MRFTRNRLRFLVFGMVLVGFGVVAYFLFRDASGHRDLQRTFDGSSSRLEKTVVIPTLDNPFLEGKSVVWCGSFQLAWKELASLTAGQPLDIAGAEEVVQRLNRSPFTKTDVSADSYYAAAGFGRDGIVERIQKEMKDRFPDVTVPDLGAGKFAIAYAYLEASISFHLPYFEAELNFRDSKGQTSKVSGFGIGTGERRGTQALRSQIDVLFDDGRLDEPADFALDLDKSSSPNQIIMARISTRGTLAEIVAELQRRIDQEIKKPSRVAGLGPTDQVLVPAMNWRIEHEFMELTGKDKPIRAFQVIQLKLDKSGADLKSEAGLLVKSQSRYFYFNEPYLIVMRKRGAKEPFFVMWVDNAELMVKR